MSGGGGGDEVTASVRVVNRLGVHARPVSQLVAIVKRHRASVTVRGPGGEADGASLLQMLGLLAPKGSELTFTARGHDARTVVAALADLVARGFDEDD